MRTSARINAYFTAKGWTRFRFQREAWRAYREGRSGLIYSPTGSGKTLAAWLGPVRRALETPAENKGLQVLWITPLRALANDLVTNLRDSVEALDLPWRVEIRTGDTGSSVRSRQRQKPPDALITTPESLSLLLSYAEGEQLFSRLHTVIVDEWHELIGTKRGVQLELCLARLRRWRPDLQTWGLSATLGNVDEAMQALLGPQGKGILIRDSQPKTTHIEAVLPVSAGKFPWSGHLGLQLLPQVVELLENRKTTLLFTNTRAQAEQWAEALVKARPDWQPVIDLHHGSIDQSLRLRIEQNLRAGALRCVVCTSSLDLGVDFSPVDQVIQVGSPKGVARLLQRAGRSGHQPGAESRVMCVPTHAFELVEIAAARHAAEAGLLESRPPLRLCLDVLAQHLITIGLGSGFEAKAMREEIESTMAFAGLQDAQWQWVLDFITRGGQTLQGYPQFHKVIERDGVYRVEDRRLAAHHRMSIGTITSNTAMRVQWLRGGILGHVEEDFIAKLRKHDHFLFAGRLVKLVMVQDMTAYVQQAKNGARTVPRWQGGRMPLSSELADSVLALLGRSRSEDVPDPEMQAVRDLLTLQHRWSRIPDPSILLCEMVRGREGVSLFCYPFGGRLVHEGLATLLAYRLTRLRPMTFKLSVNDYGFELLSKEDPDLDEPLLSNMMTTQNLLEDLHGCVNTTELARRQFRDIARIAGLVFQGFPGKNKTTKQIQASSSLIYDVFTAYDPHNLLLDQAWREVLENQLQSTRLTTILTRIGTQTLVLTHPKRLTPLAFPLWAERIQSQTISSETWRERVLNMIATLEKESHERRSVRMPRVPTGHRR
ncbi:ligase-associated DNA damage response DEXH box helicase [Candidatus Nitrospira neomarina]|uniref:Ligase-associated DNA damage response DEXH box helicase n=1 Tax=Candidatus Nitrospira neomarina TaxID=3020899 RepID=A0AA96GLJ4_9BACT|nr:ligase-associated DNA damage response DEXH box helicase [Candidatus Nitrospira neomarina]WNM63532.1 ligase-associated DNA damage response DEXH box helicase [Candidatus Nitrospira neomarina]